MSKVSKHKIVFISIFTSSFLFSGSLACCGEDIEYSKIHAQTTFVSQYHPLFNSPYQGTNSLLPDEDVQTSMTFTVFGGVRLTPTTSFYFNPELTGGSGLSKTMGVAGYVNGEIYRIDDARSKWAVSRAFLEQTIGFGGGTEKIPSDKNQLMGQKNRDRLTIVVGKFSLNDYFDNNKFAHDPRTQFLNWALMDIGAWDYAADTRGYTMGAMIDFKKEDWSLRVASVMVPKEANQMILDTSFPTARGDNIEFEYRYKWSSQPGTLRIMAYQNHANMGDYKRAVSDPSVGLDIKQTRSLSVKTGAGVGWEQNLREDFGVFARLGFNDGQTETWAFTEIDRSLAFGASLSGQSWERPGDTIGAALVFNGLSTEHTAYLNAGGYGFIVGDSKLNYGIEEILETYYSYKEDASLAISFDYQMVNHPAYNADRGPVSVFGLRMHFEM